MINILDKKILIILESPSKMKTISTILKKINVTNFKIIPTMGHIKDLPKNSFGLKIEKDRVIPTFVFLPNKKKIVQQIARFINDYNYVILATDPDREGEAISFHVYTELAKISSNIVFKRAFVNEITYQGVLRGLQNLGNINYSMVESQITRRIIDRIIGYKISPILWKKFRIRGLSAGRVQTATLKILTDREIEIQEFKPQKYFYIKLKFKIDDNVLESPIYRADQILRIFDEKDLNVFKSNFLKKVMNKKFRFDISNIERSIIPPDPLKTSTLQQEAAKIGINNTETMKIAQKLYEGVVIDGEEIGLITYHRTDSTRISEYGMELAKKIIGKIVVHARRNKSIFDAHEAIRITTTKPLPTIRKYLNEKEYKVYELIYKRFLASLSPACKYIHQQITSYLDSDLYIKYEAAKILDKGFLKIIPEYIEKYKVFKSEFIESTDRYLEIIDYEIVEDCTKPPPRYTLASIVKKMEEVGIGRPSTYAPTIEILKKRKYIEIRKGVIYVTNLGKKVIEFLFSKYSDLLNVEFTSMLESILDEIEGSNYSDAKRISFEKIIQVYRTLEN
ncbi:MAG: type IA DNA topoisomerase [Candidatus Calescibacterium sp.]|nr:type IA DNA topoisomerase [Candidatus Calescibacterium sp.]MDW8195420.1 type IA DNA topoisomerase [Candidatus Calescibacterium sp.]